MRPRNKKKPMSEINVVPYIDVMLVLLIIFMITAPLLSQGVNVNLPKISSEPMLPEPNNPPVIISVDSQGNYYIAYGSETKEDQGKPVAANILVNRIAALLKYAAEQNRPKTRVFIKGDTNVPYGRVVELMSMLQNAGVDGVGLVTEPPDG
ncbi:MAG: biopolymer transport protein TolR [Gammaproteobacteria bacterium]|jgi:biopolymer transport protein TolR